LGKQRKEKKRTVTRAAQPIGSLASALLFRLGRSKSKIKMECRPSAAQPAQLPLE
jgi:hypothetical protein